MRIAASRPLRVCPGDEVVVRGKLPQSAHLSRLFVFAADLEDERFSPYALHAGQLPLERNGMPPMQSPMSMRLVEAQPVRELTFVSDIDGFICIMQEVDTAKDPRAMVLVTR